MRLIPVFFWAAAALSAVDLDSITVTGTRTSQRLAESPVVTEIITEKEIRESGSSNLSEVLSSYGIILDGDASHGDAATLQGLGSSRVLVLVDGRRVVGRVAQNLEGAGLPLGNVDRVEILRGPQSALYGSDAMGGVINIITKKPALKPSGFLQIENTSVPTYDNPKTSIGPSPEGGVLFQRQRVEGVLHLPLGPLLTSVTATGSRTLLYLDESGEVSILPRSLTGKLTLENRWAPDGENEASFGLSGTALREEDQTDFTFSLDRKELFRAEVYGGWKHLLEGGASLETKVYNHWYRRSTSTYSGGLDQWTLNDPNLENFSGAEVWYTTDLSEDNQLTLGAQVSWDLVQDTDLSVKDGWALSDAQALVVQDQQFGGDLYSVVSGLRVERGSRFGLFAAPKVSAMFSPWKGIRFLGGAGVGYRAPSTEDLYYDVDWSWHPIVLGNLDLTPEYSLAANLGVEMTEGPLSSRVNAYHQELFDEIVTVEKGTASDGRTIFQNENNSRTSRTGADTEVSAVWGVATFHAAYGYLFPWDRDEQAVIETLAAQQARGDVTLAWQPWGLSVRVRAEWDSLRNHTVWGAGLTQSWGGFEVYARGENLTNVIDTAHGPFSPVNVTLGVRYKS